MSASNEELLNSIRNYQRSLDKYASFNNTYKLIGIIEKLKRLPIATFHLEETGIGRTVNSLRKLGGEIGEAAKSLVARWKEMVLQEEKKGKENAVDEIADEACVNENDNDCHEEKESSCKEDEDRKYLEKQSSSSHKSSDTEKNKNEYSTNGGSGSSSREKDKYQDVDRPSKKRRKSDSSIDEHVPKRSHDSSGFESEEEIYEEKLSKSTSKRNNESESSENEEQRDRKHKSKKSRHSKDSSDSEDSHKKHKSSKSSRDSSSRKSKSREKTESKKRDYDSSSDRETDKSRSKYRSDSKSKRESDCEEDKSSSKHKNKKSYESSDNEETKHKSKHDSKSRREDSSKTRESKSHSSHSDKHEKKDKKESKKDELKEKHSHRKGESRTHEEKHSKPKEEKESSKKHKSSSSSRQEESSKPSSSSSKHKSSSDMKKEKVKPPKPVNTEKIMNGIDSGSGASFAEALGMCGPMVSKSSSSSSKKKSSSSLTNYERPRSSSNYVRPEKTEVEEDNVPSLLKEQPQEPININISSLLPDITPNYRPVGFPIDTLPKRVLSQDEALSQVISNKNMRTKVYSGNKSFGKVETLFDLCVRILQDNIDALEYTGGVPYLILKPVLERATPDQLFNMEHHNPYLIEDTDELWQLHCQKEFRNKKREELESWREMYMRCLNEREARLNAITANIKQSQDKSTPIRTTKLAYIDSVVKPPRNIARKQAKNGTTYDKKPAQTPASRVAALASHADTGKVAVPNPGHRATDRSSSTTAAAVKPKKAPLMAKTLSFLKNRFRR